MVAGRSWSSITKGIDKAEKSAAEVYISSIVYSMIHESYLYPECIFSNILCNIFFQSKEIKENVAKYIKQIADVLAFVNRQMILIFKTNDLLRTIEHNLGTSNRYCVEILT